MNYLRDNAYPAVDTILSKAGNELEVVDTPWGTFYFGLIHYDFEPDNVFYNEITETYNPIDFDDAMYHWYVLDIEQSIDSIKEDIPEEQVETSINEFIK